MKRRTILSAAAPAALLAACSSTGTPAVSATVAETDALTADLALIKIDGLIASSPTATDAQKAEAAQLSNGSTGPLDLAAAGLQALIAATPAAGTTVTAASVMSDISTGLNVLEPIVSVVSPGAALIMTSVQVLLLAFEAISGAAPVAAAKVRAKAAAGVAVPPVEVARVNVTLFLATH